MILIIGDGLGANQIELARLAAGGKLPGLSQLPYSGVVTTNAAAGLTDSAAAGTALACGVKTDPGHLALSPGGQPLETILERCARERKATGLVTTGALWRGPRPPSPCTPGAGRSMGKSRGSWPNPRSR